MHTGVKEKDTFNNGRNPKGKLSPMFHSGKRLQAVHDQVTSDKDWT